MAKKSVGLLSKVSAEANAAYSGSKAAVAADASGNESPTVGKSIPIIAGGARPKGEVIWARTSIGKDNSCRGDLAVCFGRNAFGRSLLLRALAIDGTDVYARKDGVSIDPASTIRFYDGTQTAADPLIVSVEGAANTPAWTGYIYAVIEDILLTGDREFHAEFSDNSTSGAVQIHTDCDPLLQDVDLVYNERTGLSYGLLDPMTGESSIIITDGCRILNKVPLTSPFSPEYDLESQLDTDGMPFFAQRIYPLYCSDYVVITGYSLDWSTNTDFPERNGISYSPVFDPFTGRMVHSNLADIPWDTMGLASAWDDDPAIADSGVEWKVSYRLPGEIDRFAYLRMFNPADCIAAEADFVYAFDDNLATLDSGNIACQIVQVGTGEIDGWAQDMRRSRSNSSAYKPRIDDWNVRGSPEVDDFLLCTIGGASVRLAGMKGGTGEFTVYVWDHSAAGVEIFSTTVVTLPNASWTADGLNYDEDSQNIIVGARHSSGTTTPRVYSISFGGSVSYQEQSGAFDRVLGRPKGFGSDGKVVVTDSNFGNLGVLDTATGDTTVLRNGATPDSTPTVDVRRNLIVFPVVDGTTFYATGQVTTDDVLLSDLITDICSLKGYSSSDLVFEGFTYLYARGMTISSTTRVADLINRIGQLYGFVFTETDGKLKFRRRRNDDGSFTHDATLTDADLIEGPENITVQRQAATTVVGSLSLTWLDPARNYESNNVMARRFVGVLSGEAGTRDEEISLPLAIDQEAARYSLFESFYAMVEGETRVGFSVGPEHLRIEPGDLITITADGATRTVQARRVTHRADLNILEVEADLFLAQASPIIFGAIGGIAPPAEGAIFGSYIHLDMPLVIAADYPGAGLVRQYHGLTTFDADSWGGADLYRSGDDVTFTKLLDYDSAPMTVGVAQNALGDCPQDFSLDEVSSLTIEVAAGDAADFSSVSYYDMASGETLCAYGRAGAWELIAFETATENVDGTITLTNLHRGLFGTHQIFFADGSALSHLVGDYVCFIDPSRLRSSVRSAGIIGRSDRHAVVTADVGLDGAMRPRHRMPGISMRPPPVANVIAEHVAGDADLVITWDTTSPIPHTWEDTGTAGVMPETYTYTVVISTLADGDFTFTTTAATYTWTAYGSTLGATALAHVEIVNVSVMVTSPVWGDSFTTYAREIREA